METLIGDSIMPTTEDQKYLDILLRPIQVSASYQPKMGQGKSGYSLKAFQEMYQGDQFYSWLGLDNPLMYTAHKAAGGMTSIYRQIGIGGEKLFREILRDRLELSSTEATWSYEVPVVGKPGKTRKLSLDGRIPLDKVKNVEARQRVQQWMQDMAISLGVERTIADDLMGTVFEVRQGYKSKDSKRQNADLANAATAYVKAYLPCVVVLSAQIDSDIVQRYRASNWGIVTGVTGMNDPLTSTYDFVEQVIGYDLVAFFERNSKTLKKEVDKVLQSLLATE